MKITATAVLNLKRPYVSSHFTSKSADRSRLSIAGTSSLRVINECIDGPLYVRHSWKMKNEINGESAGEACPHLLSSRRKRPF